MWADQVLGEPDAFALCRSSFFPPQYAKTQASVRAVGFLYNPPSVKTRLNRRAFIVSPRVPFRVCGCFSHIWKTPCSLRIMRFCHGAADENRIWTRSTCFRDLFFDEFYTLVIGKIVGIPVSPILWASTANWNLDYKGLRKYTISTNCIPLS